MQELESSSLAAISIGGDDLFDFFLSALPFDYKDVGRAAGVRILNATTDFIKVGGRGGTMPHTPRVCAGRVCAPVE